MSKNRDNRFAVKITGVQENDKVILQIFRRMIEILKRIFIYNNGVKYPDMS